MIFWSVCLFKIYFLIHQFLIIMNSYLWYTVYILVNVPCYVFYIKKMYLYKTFYKIRLIHTRDLWWWTWRSYARICAKLDAHKQKKLFSCFSPFRSYSKKHCLHLVSTLYFQWCGCVVVIIASYLISIIFLLVKKQHIYGHTIF